MAKKSIPTLVLDVDGVLNRCGKSAQGLEHEQCELLREIIKTTGCHVVVSSTWRKTEWQRERLIKLLLGMGATIAGWTPILDFKANEDSLVVSAVPKDQEITAWLKDHPEVTRYVVLDDDIGPGSLVDGHLVQTQSFVGLTRELADECIKRLNCASLAPADP
jgi:hypothetical protein